MRHYWETVATEGDLMQALADGYFTKRIPDAFFRGAAGERIDFLLKLFRDFKADCIVWYSLMYRDSYDVEGYILYKTAEKLGIPIIRLNSDYDTAETGHFRTRIETLVRTIQKR
jgi:benzoyl-CoA reductase/2-hydroxyglutaryl-CoA dehydratase subunit BcrC/BadD/HgdB